jgi:hypothetical protein
VWHACDQRIALGRVRVHCSIEDKSTKSRSIHTCRPSVGNTGRLSHLCPGRRLLARTPSPSPRRSSQREQILTFRTRGVQRISKPHEPVQDEIDLKPHNRIRMSKLSTLLMHMITRSHAVSGKSWITRAHGCIRVRDRASAALS